MGSSLKELVEQGKIKSLEELKAAYHALVMSTHPDAVGSDRLLEAYLESGRAYEEARAHLRRHGAAAPQGAVSVNNRLEFYRNLRIVETLEAPYAYHPEENATEVAEAKKRAARAMAAWRPGHEELYRRAQLEYTRLKREKPSGPYMKDALALNVRPVFHTITAFHLTGRDLYARQSRRNRSGIAHQLDRKGCRALRELLDLLYDDLGNGAAVFE